MIKITTVVAELLDSSEIALEAMRAGVLNLSAFADQIHSEVEARTLKTVKRASIVVALSRLAKKASLLPDLKPKVILDSITIKSPLCDLTFEKTDSNLDKAKLLIQELSQNDQQFLTITQGTEEITIIATEENQAEIKRIFGSAPKAEYQDLVGITVRFSEKYLLQPNTIYAILSLLAVKRINVIEIVSTYTELTVLVEKDTIQTALDLLQSFFVRH
jgi:aspartokinase